MLIIVLTFFLARAREAPVELAIEPSVRDSRKGRLPVMRVLNLFITVWLNLSIKPLAWELYETVFGVFKPA